MLFQNQDADQPGVGHQLHHLLPASDWLGGRACGPIREPGDRDTQSEVRHGKHGPGNDRDHGNEPRVNLNMCGVINILCISAFLRFKEVSFDLFSLTFNSYLAFS